MRWSILAAVLCVLSQVAMADCDDEAHAVRAGIPGSGPFHFEAESWGDNFRRRLCGRIVPDHAWHRWNCDDPSSWERIRIGDQGWSNDGLGWEDPLHTGGGEGELSPESVFPFNIIETRCSGQVSIEGRAVKQYEFVIRAERVERIVVDAATGMLVRYEERPLRARGASRAITYRYDPDIRIEPPVVDLEKRRATSLQRLREAAARSEPACRRETVDAIRHGGASAFEFDIRVENWSHVKGFLGRFAPPRSFHVHVDGWRTEMVQIDNESWIKVSETEWRSEPRSFWRQVVAGRVPDESHIGYVSCPGLTLIDGISYRVYEYDLYVDTKSARVWDGTRRMLVHPTTGLPWRIEQISGLGREVETRRYDAAIAVERPPAPPPLAMPYVPFDEFRRRLSLD